MSVLQFLEESSCIYEHELIRSDLIILRSLSFGAIAGVFTLVVLLSAITITGVVFYRKSQSNVER